MYNGFGVDGVKVFSELKVGVDHLIHAFREIRSLSNYTVKSPNLNISAGAKIGLLSFAAAKALGWLPRSSLSSFLSLFSNLIGYGRGILCNTGDQEPRRRACRC